MSETLCRQLVDGAVAVREGEIEAALNQAFAVLSPDAALSTVIVPALVEIGERWAQGRCSVAGEHLASTKVTGRLLNLLETINPTRNNGARLAICACFPDEQHEIGALMMACTMARYHYRVSYLGACLPLEDLERACLLLTPDVVSLSVSREYVLLAHRPRLLELLRRLPSTTQVVVGGRGVAGADGELEESGLRMVRAGGPSLDDVLAARAHKTLRRGRREK